MARSGLSKGDIQKVRDTLISQGQYPSVDAVRIALGNTGSKTTIHKYLKELEIEEEKGTIKKITISESIEHLIHCLAEQLQVEANIEVEKLTQMLLDKEQEHEKSVNLLHNEIESLTSRLTQLELASQQELDAYHNTKALLQEKQIQNSSLEQQVISLKEEIFNHKNFQKSHWSICIMCGLQGKQNKENYQFCFQTKSRYAIRTFNPNKICHFAW